MIRAVVFDLGGVIVDSPLHVIADYERREGITPGAINRVVVDAGADGAWSRLERGEVRLPEFYPAFEADCRDRDVVIDARALMEAIGAASAPRPRMLEAVARIRARGLSTAALTNNWVADDGRVGGLDSHFDVFVESAVEGLRKPDPRIYTLVCERLGVAPAETAFLDDIGRNLKAARALGMTTIKVVEPEEALRELEALLGFALG